MIDQKKLKDSFGCAWIGLKENHRKEQNFRIQILVGMIILLLAALLNVDWEKIVLLILVIGVVLSFEIMNSAIERYIDYLSPQEDKTIGRIKDMLAGAVLVSTIVSVMVGIIIFYQPIVNLFK